MNIRMNAGYIITDSVRVGEMEFVLGVSSYVSSQFVTWACKDGKDYYWGHYHDDLLSATKDLLARASQELEFCLRENTPNQEPAKAPQKEPEEPCL